MRDGTGRYGRVLLLGGTSEIGLAILAAVDLRPGADVLLAGRDLAALERVPLPEGTHRQSLRWDARHGPGPLVEQALAGGDLDLVIAAAGILGSGAHDDPVLAHEVLAINLLGLVDVLVPLGEALRRQRHGTLVVLSSVAAVRPRKANFVYAASKAGLDSFARGLADRLHGEGVRVLLVRPGFVRGRMTAGLPAAPLATSPQAVGQAVRKALASGSDAAWAPPLLRVVMLLLSLLPRRLWRRLEQ